MKKILIIGRPNVGKSSLFNRLIKKRRALVMNTPGVTRDIIKEKAYWWGTHFEVWDSGGFIFNATQSLSKNINHFVQDSLKKVDCSIMVMDATVGLHEDDKSIFKLIKSKPYLLVVNKIDKVTKSPHLISEFYSLGNSFIESSFERETNIDQIVSWVIEKSTTTEDSTVTPHFSIMLSGQPNVGKSSLFNKIVKKNRSIISPKPHTTVDVVDDFFLYQSQTFEVLDSSGIGKKSKQTMDIQRLASAKTLSYYDKTNFVLLVIDASKKISKQDIRLFSYCLEKNKPSIIVANKWDLAFDTTKVEIRKTIKKALAFYPEIPILFTNALSGLGVPVLIKKILEIKQRSEIQIPTSKLNFFLKNVTQQAPPPVYGTRNIKFFYLTQTKKKPPQFLIFTNHPKGVSSSYKKFLTKKIQNEWNLKGIPIQLVFKKRK